MKLFSNQGQHLSTTKQPKKTTSSVKLISEKSVKPKKLPVQNTISKEDIHKLFDEPKEAVLPVESTPSAPVAEDPVVPIVVEPIAPVIEEPVAPVIEEPVVPVVEEPVVPVVEEPVAPVVEEPVAPVVEEPIAPVVEEPVVPVVEEPVAATSFDGDTIVIAPIIKETEIKTENRTSLSAAKAAFKRPALKESLYFVILALLLALLIGISAFFINALKDTIKMQKELLDDYRATADVTPMPTDTTDDSLQPVEPTPEVTPEPTPQPTPEAPLTVLEKYAKDAEKNPDMFGWIQIEGTKIDYPVMHTPNDPEKYLYKSFNGWPTASGTLFIDAHCSPDSDNLIIYGHNIKNGTMFNSIIKYENIDYFNEHPVIKFDTIYEEQEFEVMSAFYDRVYYKSETDVFKFYQFIDAENEEHFNSAVQTLKDKSIYDTEVTAEYGDQLIMLVTCAYHTENGRFVVVARKSA